MGGTRQEFRLACSGTRLAFQLAGGDRWKSWRSIAEILRGFRYKQYVRSIERYFRPAWHRGNLCVCRGYNEPA